MEEKKKQILNYEEFIASQLASQVIEKPVPPVWMIFVPIFFVFHIWKIKEYSQGLKDFIENYLISRRRALETAFEAEQRGGQTDIRLLVEKADDIPVEIRPIYHEWMSILVNHYRGLLSAPGTSHQELKRAHYGSKTNYLLFCNQLSKIENAFNLALLPMIEGDQDDIRYVLDKIYKTVTAFRHKEVEEIFL